MPRLFFRRSVQDREYLRRWIIGRPQCANLASLQLGDAQRSPRLARACSGKAVCDELAQACRTNVLHPVNGEACLPQLRDGDCPDGKLRTGFVIGVLRKVELAQKVFAVTYDGG